jgi:hypothetical protein
MSSNIQSIINALSNTAGVDEKSGESNVSKATRRACASLASSLQLEQDHDACSARDELAIASAKRRFRVAKATRSERTAFAIEERLAMAAEVLRLTAVQRQTLTAARETLAPKKAPATASPAKASKGNGKAPEGVEVLPA